MIDLMAFFTNKKGGQMTALFRLQMRQKNQPPLNVTIV